MKTYYVYMMASKRNGTLYTGVTSNLVKRVYQHRNNAIEGFAKRYGVRMLVWYDTSEEVTSAIEKEKQIKAGNRKKKLQLIETVNPDWRDLYEDII